MLRKQCIFIGTRQLIPKIPENTTIRFHNTTITPVSHVKNLGVYMDCYLSFDKHITATNQNVVRTLMYIKKVKHCFNKQTRTLVVQ